MLKIKYVIIFVSIFFVSKALATVIDKIDVEGNQRVNKEYISSIIQINNKESYSSSKVELAVKKLYNTDVFSSVTYSFNNGILLFKVVENPIVNKVIFVGNSSLKKEALSQELLLTKNLTFSTRKLTADLKRIQDLYLKSGFLSTNVTYTFDKLDYNRINITFHIVEGKKSKIASIKFVGNKSYSSSKLKNNILTVESRWWRILNPNDVYDANRIAYDGELLRQFYRNNGYIDFSILSSYVTINRENKYNLIFNISEGDRFKFSDFKLNIKVERLSQYKNELEKLLKKPKNIWFSKNEVDRVVANLNKKLNSLGFNRSKVDSNIIPDDFSKTISVNFEITESKANVIESINITGNDRTYDSVIRRSLFVREGDVFNKDTINRSRVDVYNLGFFGDVNVTSYVGSAKDKTIIDIDVKEKPTGYISLGGGYSTYDGFLLQTTFSEPNMLGSGKGLDLSASLSQKELSLDATLSNPYLFDRKIFGSIRLFNTTTDYTSSSSYKLNRTGLSPTISYNLTDNLLQSFNYSIARTDIYNVNDSASVSIKESAGKKLSSIITHTLQYDKRDNVIYTTQGYLLNFTTNLSGLGGDVFYLRNNLTASYYYDLYKDIVLSFVGSVGYIGKIRSDVDILISDKFFLGGSSLRGFDWSGIGPRDETTGDALGGNTMFRFSAQIDLPIPAVENYGLLFHIFSDNGTVYNIDSFNENVVQSIKLRSTAGFGLSWRSPFGLISLDWAWPLYKQPEDKEQRFLLNFGARI